MEFQLGGRLGEVLRVAMTEGRRSFPIVAAVWISLYPGVLTLREQGGGGRRKDTLGKVGEQAAGVCDKKVHSWGLCDYASPFRCLFLCPLLSSLESVSPC